MIDPTLVPITTVGNASQMKSASILTTVPQYAVKSTTNDDFHHDRSNGSFQSSLILVETHDGAPRLGIQAPTTYPSPKSTSGDLFALSVHQVPSSVNDSSNASE